MADPKYAKLPGIDLNSPDVYETDDLPEDEQALRALPEELNSESVEKIQIDTESAYKQFKGKGVEAPNIDFSDRISDSKRTGYVAKDEYEMLGDGSGKIESPQQRYARLQHEIRDLTEQVGRIKENVKAEGSAEKLSPVTIGKQLEYLQHQLTDLHLEKLLGPGASIDLSDPQGALQKRLVTQLESFKPSQTSSKPGPPAAPGNKEEGPSDHVTYELYYRPEQAQFSRNAKLASLEERLDRLEAALGAPSPDKLGLLSADTDNKSLIGAVSVVNSKLSLLEPTNLEQIDVRLHSVIQKLDKIAEKRATQEDGEKQNKISELYAMVKKWESVSDSLPHVVDRLAALKDLHEQALQFSQALAYLDTTQQEISNNLQSHGDMMKQLEATIEANTKTIRDNCESLDGRIKALKK